MAAPTFVQTSPAATWACLTAHTSLTATLPATATVGNLLVLPLGLCDTTSPNAPAGWDLATFRVGATEAYIALFWKVSDGTETAITFTWTGNDGAAVALLEYAHAGSTDWVLGDATDYAWDVLNPANWPPLNPNPGEPAVLIFHAFDNGPSASVLPASTTLRHQSIGSTFPGMRVGDILTATADPTYDLLGQNTVGAEYQVASAAFHPVVGALPDVDDIALLYDVYRIIPPGDDIEYLATLDDAFAKSIRPVRNGPGSGQFSINRNSANATADILAPGNLVKVRIPEIHSDHIFAFFMDRQKIKLLSEEEGGGEVLTIGGDGALAYWDRAIWLSMSFLIEWWPGSEADPPAGARGYVNVAAGTHYQYTVSGNTITARSLFSHAAFFAYWDEGKRFKWPGSPTSNKGRQLLRIMTGPHTGKYLHSTDSGIVYVKATHAIGNSVLLSDISPDTPGVVLKRLYDEGVAATRPAHPIPLMTIDFDDTTDSDGNAWATTDALSGITAELGETYLDTIAKLLGTGEIDVEMGPDLDMHGYNAQGRDLTSGSFAAGKVRFVKGVNIAYELNRERDDLPVGTFIEVVGNDNVVGQAELPDAATRVTREVAATGDSNDETVLDAVGLAALTSRLIRSDAVGFRIATGDDDAAGLYLPGPPGSDNGDFWLGDVVRVHTGTDETDFDEEDLRVYAITITEDEAGNLEVTCEVGSLLGEAERQLYGLSSPQSFGTIRSQLSDTVPEPSDTYVHADLLELDADDHAAYETVIDGGGPTVQDHGSMGATETVNAALGNQHRGVLSADCTITVTPFADGAIVLRVDQDGTGGRAITWSGVTFAGDDQPAQGIGEVSWFVLVSDDGTVFGFRSGGGSTVAALDDLSDATITAPAAADRLRYSGSAWVNSPLKWYPVMATDGTNWYVVVDGSGTAVLSEA